MNRHLELWLVRHGETAWNLGRKLAGWTDVPLNEKGQDQARALKPLLDGEPFETVWASDYKRAVETARLAYGDPVEDVRLREINFGDLEGASYEGISAEYQKTLLEFSNFEAPNGESLTTLKARVMDFIASLNPGRHLIFTHGGVIRVLTSNLGQDQFMPNGALIKIDWTVKKVLFVQE